MASVDLCFRVLGTTVPRDHGYALYGAVSRILGHGIHEANGVGLHAINGMPAGDGLLALTDKSRLRVRTPLEQIPALLALSGKSLDIDGHRIRLGVPQTYALVAAATLVSRVVTIKCARPLAGLPPAEQAEVFLAAVRQKLTGTRDYLNELGLPEAVQAAIPLRRTGPHAGEPTRRVLRIKDKTIVGFAVIVSGLTAEESLTLQEKGVGGRRHMGCGIFLPARSGPA